jgi:hypothetical protein
MHQMFHTRGVLWINRRVIYVLALATVAGHSNTFILNNLILARSFLTPVVSPYIRPKLQHPQWSTVVSSLVSLLPQ